MSGRRSKKNQRLGSSRRGPKGLSRNIEKDDDDDGFPQIAESEDGQNEFHTSTDYHSAQFDHPPSSSIDQQTSALESLPYARGHVETEFPERKRKMGSTRKSTAKFKDGRKLDEVRTTEELDEEYIPQPNTSTTEEQHEEEQSRPMSFPSDLSHSSGLGKDPGTALTFVVSENEEKAAIHHQEITSHSHEVVSDMPLDEAMGTSIHSFAVTAESDLLREKSVMFDEPKTLEIPLASGPKRRMGSTRRPLGGKNSEKQENVGVQEHSTSMTKNERKAEVTSEEMAQTWDDVARDDPSSYAESSLVLNQSLLAERAKLKEPDISAGTETKNQSVAFPLVDSEKPLPETSSHHGTPLLNEGLDFKFALHTEGFDVLNDLKDAGSHLSDNSDVPDTRKDTNTSYDFRDVNTESKEEFLKQKEELSINDQTSSLLPKQDGQLEELALNDQESSSQHDIATLQNNSDSAMPQLLVGGSRSFDVPLSNISHDEPTTTNLPHEMSDAVEKTLEIHIEKEQGNNLCNVASVTCDTLTDLASIMEEHENPQILATRENENVSDERGSETENAFEMTDQDDARDHSVTQIIMDVRDNEKDGETRTEAIWISHQKPSEVSAEKEELYKGQVQCLSNISQKYSPPQDDVEKMLENDEVTQDKKETENAAANLTSKSEEMFSFEDSATDTGSHAHQLLMQSPDEEDYDLHENVNEKSEKEEILFSVESENADFDRGDGRSQGTERIKELDAAPVVILDVDTNNSESENPEQNRVSTEDQTDTSTDTNLQVLAVSDNVSTLIDSGLPLDNVAVVSSGEESHISSFIPEDSQDSYKPRTFHPESQENTEDAERAAIGGDTDLHLEIEAQNKTSDSTTSEAEGTEENINDASVLVREVEIIGDIVTVESNITTELDFLQTSPDTHVETLKVSVNAEKEFSGETDTILKHSDRIIPADSHGKEAHSKSSPDIHKRKMGSTRRPLKGKKGQRQEHDEKEIFNLDDEPSPDESTLQSSKDEAKGHEMGICEKNDVGPVEGSESGLLQSSCSSDLVSEESLQSQGNSGDVESVPADLQLKIDSQNKTFDLTTSEAEGTEQNIQDVSVSLLREVEVIGDTVTVESNMTTESDFPQTSPDAHMEALKVSENPEKEVSGETDTIFKQSYISIIPEDSHGEETHSKSSPVIHKRKMGSTRRPLKENKGQRKEIEHLDEDETPDSEGVIKVENETIKLEDKPSPDEYMLQSLKDGAKEQVEICEKNDFGPVEGSESALLQSSCSSDLDSEESAAISICHITESQTLTKINEESQENTGDDERVPAEEDKDLQLKIDSQNQTFDLTTSEAEGTRENIQDVSVSLLREVEVIGDTVTVESNMTTESDFPQTSPDAHIEALKVSENAEKEVSEKPETVSEQSDISIIPADSHREETHSKLSPFVHKRKIGSTRRPLKGNKGQRKETEHHDENEPPDSEGMINVEKETFSLEDEPSPDESTLQSLKDGAKEQEMEMKNDVCPVEGSESALLQSSCISDLVSEESTAISICHVTESQTLTKMNEESQENAEDAERAAVGGDTDLHLEIEAQNKTSDSTTSEAEGTVENKQDASVLVREVVVIGDMVTVESNITTEFDFLQTSPNADKELKSENTEKEVSGKRDTILEQSDIRIIPAHSHGEEAHSRSSLIVSKRKMGSTRRPLKEKKGQRQKHDEKDIIFNLEDEPSPDESTLQSSKDEAKGHEMGIYEKNDVGPTERSESADLQSSCSSDLVSEESTAVSTWHITESQTLTKIYEESQENYGDVESVPADLQMDSQNKTFDTATSEAEGTEENIQDISVTLVRKVEVIGDTVTVESSMTTDSDFLQTYAHVEALKISENDEKVVSGKTATIPTQSDMSIIPADSYKEETHSKSRPVTHKRKMGSTRRPLKGKKGQRKETEHDENETLDSEGGINAGKDAFSLEEDPSPDESTLHSTKDGAKEQTEICEKNYVGPVEGSESALLQSSCISDLVSEESTAISICHITESQTLIKMNEESQENTGDVERVPAEEDKDLQLSIGSQNKTFDSITSEAERTEENIQDVSVTLVREVEVSGDTVTVESNMTTESDFLQTSPDAHIKALKVSGNTEKEVSGETETIPEQSDMSIIPADSHREETHSKSSPVIHKRKMGSTRRPLRGNTGRRKDHDEKDILEDEPSLDQSGYTAVSICDISESQTVRQINAGYQENTGDAERLPAEEDKDFQLKTDSQNKRFDLTTSEPEETDQNIQEVSVMLVREVEFIGDTVSVDNNMTTESDLIQNDTSFEAKLKASINAKHEDLEETDAILKQSDTTIIPEDPQRETLKVPENADKEVSGETDTILKQSDINIVPEDTHEEETHSKLSPFVHKRKMGSTRRPLRGNKGQRKETEHQDENEPLDNDGLINVEKETISLENKPSPYESTLQILKDGAKEQEMEICEKNYVGPVEGSESALLQLPCSSDLVSEESNAISICHVTESQTLTKINEESKENAEDAERAAVGGDTDLHLEIEAQNKTSDSTTSEAEGTEENKQDASVLVREVKVIGDMVTVESNMTTEFDFHQTSPDADRALKSENTEKEVSGERDTILEQSDIRIIPAHSHGEEAHSKSSLIVQKRKMGSTRRPLKGKKGQRQKHDEKEIFNLEDEPSPDESTLQSSKDEAKGHEMGIYEKNDVGPTERSESADLQSSCSSDLVSEESTAVSTCHITESQTLTTINQESQENAEDVEIVPADLQLKMDLQNKTFDLTINKAEGTEENIQDVSVTLVREVEVIGDKATVESSMTTESDFLQTSPDAHIEALKISEITEKEVSGKTDTIPEQSDMSIIPADSHREETHSKSSPVIHKRKMGSTRRPLKGNTGQRKDHDQKEIFEDEPSPDESRHTAASDISESLTLTKIHAGSLENSGNVEILPVGGDTESHLQNKTFDSTAFEGEATKENICEPSVLVKDVKFSGDAVIVEKNMTTESDSIQNDTSSEAKLEALKVSDSAECEVLDIHAILKQSDTSIIPEDTQKEEAHSKLHPVVHKRKMGSTRRPLKGKKGERKEIEHDENETLDSEGGNNAEKDTSCLENEPSPDESTLHSTKDGAKKQIEICEKNDFGPVEGSESALLQSSCISDLVSEESTAISICHITESQTLTKINEESQENAGDAVAAEENKDIQLGIDSQNKPFDSTISEAEGTEENIQDVSVMLVREVEVIGETATVESNMTTEALKVSEKEFSGETETILKQSDISIIPADSHGEETHSKLCPVIHKRKMGSTRRPLDGNKGRRKDHDGQEIFNLDNEPSPDESRYTVVSDISESQTHTKMHAVSQESIGDVEIAPAEGDTEPHLDNKTFDSTAFKEVTEQHLCEASALVKEVEFIGDTVVVESNMTTESDSSEAKLEALKVSDSAEHEVLEETDTIPKQIDTTIIPEDTQKEEAHSKLHPIVHKRKMGSTRRPLRDNKGQSKEIKHHDENETHDDEKEILENEPRPDEPRYTAVSDISESQTFTKFHAEPQEKYYDIERALGGRDTGPHLEIQTENTTLNSATFEREGTEETIYEARDTSSEKPEALISEIAENEISGKTDTIPKQSDTKIISEGPPKEELHTKLSLNVQKRKMGSTRRPLRGNKGQRKVGVESKEKNGDSEGLSEEEDTETHSQIQNRDNVVDHNVTQEIMNIRDNEDEERNITKTVDMSVQELCDDELEQRLDVSQTQTGSSQDDTVLHALLMEETQIHVSYDDVPPTEVAEMLPVSTMSVQKRKMGSTRKRGKRMVNEEEVEKGGEDENTTTDDGTTKSEEKLPVEEAISGSPEHQQLCSSSVNKEQNDPNSTINPELLIESKCTSNAAAEMVSDLPLGDVHTYLHPKQNVIPKESHRGDQSNLNPVVQKRKMGSTRKTLRGNKGQGREGESKIMDRGEEMTHEHDTEPRLATSAGKTESKFDEKVEQNFLVAASNMFPESENEFKEVSQNIHDLPEVSEESGMEHTGNDSNSVNKAINLYDGTKDKFVLTVSHEDVPQNMPTDDLDQHVGSEPEQTDNTRQVIPTQELKNTEDDVVHEITSQKIPATQEKRRKMGSTRRNPRVMHGKNMADNEDMLGKAEDGEIKTAEGDCISQSKEMSSVSTTDLESENENYHQNSFDPSRSTVPETPESTLQICDNQLANADVTKHPQSETVSTEKRRKMGSTRKNLREGRLRGKRDGYEDTETAESEMSLVREDVGDQTTHDYSNQSENSLLSEIESALNKSSQNSLSCDWELIVKEPNPDDLANAPVLNMPENSEIKSLQQTPSAHSEPNSPGRRRRKMGSTRKNPRQELKAERDDEDKEDGETDDDLKTNKQEKKDLEVSVVHNITENKEYLDVSSAHTGSSQLEESTNPVSQEGTSPSTKRKFGSRRANKGKQGLGSLATSDFGNELEDGDHKPDKLHNEDLAVCDPSSILQPENQPISHPVSEQRNMEARNEEAAPKGTGAGLVSLDQIMKPDRSTRAKQTVNLKNRNAEVVQFNIVMVGNSCVGKTSFIRRFHEGQFTEDYRSTIGVDTFVQTIALPDRIVKLQIWDTAGQERFHSITTQVFRKADGLLFMYEITSSNSFTSVRDWISQAQEKAPDDAIMMLLGNKNDSVERKVQIQEGVDLAREYNIHFMECSAATGANVSESMRTLAELLAQRKSEKEKHTTLRREPPQKKSGCC